MNPINPYTRGFAGAFAACVLAGAPAHAQGWPEELGRLVKTELAKWAKVIKAAGIRAD